MFVLDQRPAGLEAPGGEQRSPRVVVGGVPTSQRPDPGARGRAGSVDGRQRRRCVSGQGVDGARDGRVRGHQPEQAGFGAQYGDVSQAVPPNANDTATSSTTLAGS